MLDERIKFEERYESEENETTTLYFIAPKEMLKPLINRDYPEAISMEISIEFPTEHIEANYASVCVSPTKYDEETNSYYDYDWFDVELPYEEIDELISLAQPTN